MSITNGSAPSNPDPGVAGLPELVGAHEECITALQAYDKYSAAEIREELSMKDLNDIHGWLWIAGNFDNISPLHHQKLLQRQIFATTKSRLHLIWFGRIIFIKPLPDCLINANYFTSTISTNRQAYALASGFLRSYCYLIASSLDLALAKDLYLISKDVTWDKWHALRALVLARLPKEVIHSLINDEQMDKRWRYGELRLERLNIIYRCTGRGLTYFTIHREYSTYFNQYFNIFITVFGFLAIILTAMQIIVAIQDKPATLNTISYRFSIASLLVVAICLGYVFLVFLSMFFYNTILAFVTHEILGKDGDRPKSPQISPQALV
ncbi:hypothetical protein BP6252_10964 [Coleophoma cylindrospora]|uniref:Uncharacterized protein n=1 Tax=Coleophoma cylindrospora TaxID=1849047 RepID=A0A3D8QNQ5_9HELO|nr:hypothetical protein BP6252_10964 [Coleophoma cylindrospora]